MSSFNVFSGLLSLFVLLVFLRAIFKARATSSNTQSQTNLRLLRDQLKEIAEDNRVGNLSAEQYELSKIEIESRVLEEVAKEPQMTVLSGRFVKMVSILVVVLIPVSAFYLYSVIGSHEGQDVASFLKDQDQSFDQAELESAAEKFIEHLEQNPGDTQALGMLAKTYQALNKFDDAANALERAYQLDPNDPAILVDYAEARGLAARGNLDGESNELINRALELDPNNGKGLALGGAAAFEAGSYQLAIDRWARLLKANTADEQLVQMLQAGIAEAKIRLVQSGQEVSIEEVASDDLASQESSTIVSGVVRIAKDLLHQVESQDVVFIYARSVEGPPMPIAAMRIPVDQLPFSFVFDDSFSLMPNRKLSDFSEFLVGARISKSGNAIRASGDLESLNLLVRPGTSIEITIDSAVP
ncbi:MAG: c-type cytochrome biogenesis protein CcmI [Proteobacteria bacterium]|nr:c-type cytochrome biogenesis protein CcmI [Pseudomonadota bacterium]